MTWVAASPCMTDMNQVMSWTPRTSKGRLQSLLLCSQMKNNTRKSVPPEQQIEKQRFPTGPIYDDYDSDPWESQEEAPEESEEQSKMQFIDYAEPVSEQPPPEISEPFSVFHSPVLIRDIRPQVNNCVAEEVVCHRFPGIGHSFDDLVNEYMEWHFPYALEPPYFISTPACKEELKSVVVLLSQLHHMLAIIDRRKELLSRKLLEWLWRKFSFT
jgi:hypothetical protein